MTSNIVCVPIHFLLLGTGPICRLVYRESMSTAKDLQ